MKITKAVTVALLLLGCCIFQMCSRLDSTDSLRDAAIDQLLKKGGVLSLYRNFRGLKDVKADGEDSFKVTATFDYGDNVEVLKLKYAHSYKIYDDPVFFRNVNLPSLFGWRDGFERAVHEGTLTAIGSIVIEEHNGSRVTTREIAATLEKGKPDNNLQWLFHTEGNSMYNGLLRATKSAYAEVKESDFRRLVGPPVPAHDIE
jgi:hypothetical protein